MCISGGSLSIAHEPLQLLLATLEFGMRAAKNLSAYPSIPSLHWLLAADATALHMKPDKGDRPTRRVSAHEFPWVSARRNPPALLNQSEPVSEKGASARLPDACSAILCRTLSAPCFRDVSHCPVGLAKDSPLASSSPVQASLGMEATQPCFSGFPGRIRPRSKF